MAVCGLLKNPDFFGCNNPIGKDALQCSVMQFVTDLPNRHADRKAESLTGRIDKRGRTVDTIVRILIDDASFYRRFVNREI